MNVHAQDSTPFWNDCLEGKKKPNLSYSYSSVDQKFLHCVVQALPPGEHKLLQGEDFCTSIIYPAIENCGKTHYTCDLQCIFEFKVIDFHIAIEGAEQ